MRGQDSFLKVKYYLLKNEAIENLKHYKYILFNLVPFELNLDGNFCDETYKYALEVLRLASKFSSRESLEALLPQNNLLD